MLHFVSQKLADLYDYTNPSWLPTLNLGHEKSNSGLSNSSIRVERWERAQERRQRRDYIQEMCEMLPDIVSSEIDLIIKEDLKLNATEQIEIARQYFNPRSVAESALCTCATKIEDLQRQLVESKNNNRV